MRYVASLDPGALRRRKRAELARVARAVRRGGVRWNKLEVPTAGEDLARVERALGRIVRKGAKRRVKALGRTREVTPQQASAILAALEAFEDAVEDAEIAFEEMIDRADARGLLALDLGSGWPAEAVADPRAALAGGPGR